MSEFKLEQANRNCDIENYIEFVNKFDIISEIKTYFCIQIPGYTRYFIGGRDIDMGKGREWIWTSTKSGSRMNYTNWAPGYPYSSRNCLVIKPVDGSWFDTLCYLGLRYVCKKM